MIDRTTLTDDEIAGLVRQYPGLPSDYLEYLRNEGWGQTESECMIYQRPIPPGDVYGDGYEGPNVVLFGDDYQGYCLGYDFNAKRYGEINDFGEWEEWPESEGLLDYVTP